MRLLHGLAKIHASFDKPNLVSRAGLVLVMALAQRAGLAALAGQHVAIADRCGMNPHLKVPCLVAGMLGGDGQHRRYGSAAVPMNRKVITASAAPGTSQNRAPGACAPSSLSLLPHGYLLCVGRQVELDG